MPKKILILSGLDTPQERAVGRYKRYGSAELSIQIAGFSEVSFWLKDGNIQAFYEDELLENFHAVYFSATVATSDSPQRGFSHFEYAALIARYCVQKGVSLFDSAWNRDWWMENKSFETFLYAENALPHINTRILLAHAARFPSIDFSEPKILKYSFGNKGKQVFLCRTLAELQSTLATSPEVVILLQDYIVNSGDLRVTVVNYEARLAEQRVAAAGNYRNNVSQGGSLKQVPLTSEIADLAQRAALALKYELAGVDLIFDEKSQKWLIMEVNRVPELEPYAAEFTGDLRAEFVDCLQG